MGAVWIPQLGEIKMIPSCVKLNERQRSKVERFVKYCEQQLLLLYGDQYSNEPEDCSMMSLLEFRIRGGGICDEIKCMGYGGSIDLTIDDDGDMYGDEWLNDDSIFTVIVERTKFPCSKCGEPVDYLHRNVSWSKRIVRCPKCQHQEDYNHFLLKIVTAK